MQSLIKWFQDAPLWAKIVFALPVLDIIWAIFRIVKGAVKSDLKLVLIGILWIVLGWAILWVVDIVTIIVENNTKYNLKL